MSDCSMQSSQRGLRMQSPFFGIRPEAMSLVQADLNGSNLSQGRLIIKAASQRLEDSGCRWQIGFGPTFFTKFRSIPKPGALKTLDINGDEAFGLRPGSGESDLLIAIGGNWETAVSVARSLCYFFDENASTVRGVNIGYDAFNERDHSGFLDGTSNLQDLSPTQFGECVFVQQQDDEAFAGGSYLVFRKYEEDLEMWNDLPDSVQEHFVGREKKMGCFLNGNSEWTPSVWKKTSPCAHIRRANPREVPKGHHDYWKERIYRRGVKFTERKPEGSLRFGLLFIAIVRDPEMQFARIHNERILPLTGPKDLFLSSGYIKPLSSSCYYLPTVTCLHNLLKSSKGLSPVRLVSSRR